MKCVFHLADWIEVAPEGDDAEEMCCNCYLFPETNFSHRSLAETDSVTFCRIDWQQKQQHQTGGSHLEVCFLSSISYL